MIVHEWSHFRYGIFDEYPHKSIKNNQTLNKPFNRTFNCNKNLTNCSFRLTDQTDEFDFNEFKPILGVILSLCGSCATGIVYLVLKKVNKKKNYF